MKSIITLVVEHGETTDPLEFLIRAAYNAADGVSTKHYPVEVIDHTYKVDVEHVTVKELEALLEPVGFNQENLITGGHFCNHFDSRNDPNHDCSNWP